jgi:hypothetical protein
MTQHYESDPHPHQTGQANPEETLRLLANAPVPEQLAERVHRRLADERARQSSAAGSFGIWSLLSPARRLQYAGAAALVVAVAGSTWAVYHVPANPVASHTPVTVQPVGQAPSGSGFQTSGAERHPGSPTPILVPNHTPPHPKRKTGLALKSKAKPSAKGAALAAESPAPAPAHP